MNQVISKKEIKKLFPLIYFFHTYHKYNIIGVRIINKMLSLDISKIMKYSTAITAFLILILYFQSNTNNENIRNINLLFCYITALVVLVIMIIVTLLIISLTIDFFISNRLIKSRNYKIDHFIALYNSLHKSGILKNSKTLLSVHRNNQLHLTILNDIEETINFYIKQELNDIDNVLSIIRESFENINDI